MKTKSELEEIDIKNRVYNYFDDIINGTKNDFSSFILGKNFYENISI